MTPKKPTMARKGAFSERMSPITQSGTKTFFAVFLWGGGAKQPHSENFQNMAGLHWAHWFVCVRANFCENWWRGMPNNVRYIHQKSSFEPCHLEPQPQLWQKFYNVTFSRVLSVKFCSNRSSYQGDICINVTNDRYNIGVNPTSLSGIVAAQ